MNVEQLLKKFYGGVSTAEEELLLKEYFQEKEGTDDRMETDRLLFNVLCDETMRMPEGVSERLDDMIGRLDNSSRHVKPSKRLISYWISSAAAIVLLCIGLFFITQQSVKPEMADTFDDPVEAAVAAEKALAFMSLQLNKGVNQVAGAGQEIQRVDQILNKHLK